jgi:ribose transport system permease protein
MKTQVETDTGSLPGEDLQVMPLKTAQTTRKKVVLQIIGRLWAWLFLTLLIISFSYAPGFFSFSNFQSVIANNSLLLILALGQSFVIITGGIDLSTGFVMGLASVVASLAMRAISPETSLFLVLGVGFLASMGVGLISGVVNGLVIARLNVPPFIATLGMYGIARGIGYILSGGPPVSVNTPGIGNFGNGYLLYYHADAGFSFFHLPPGITGTALREVVSILPFQAIYIILAILFTHFLLSKTKFGQHVYAVGGSMIAARRAGIPVNQIIVKVYILSAVMASLAGFLYVTRYVGGVASAGDALMLSSIAAIVIGGASLMGGEGTMIGALVGSLIVAVIQNGLIIIGVDPFWQFVAVGVIIILAVLIDQTKAKVLS